ncbi:MAG: flagella basal body P-ring formation protein FlgA [Lachnospiraceae bacterium]
MWKLIKRKSRRKRTVLLLVSFSLLMITVTTASVCFIRQKSARYETEIDLLNAKLEGIRKTVYVAAEDLQRGETVTREKVCEEEYHTTLSGDWFMTETEFGKNLRTEVKAGTPLFSAMLEEKEVSSLREVFLSSIQVNEFMEKGDRVDVRIAYQNGEDYVVLSDKELLLYEVSGVVLLLSEEEIALLSSAMTDEKLYPDTSLYAVRYPHEGQTEKSRVTYLPNEAVAILMQQEGEMLEKRKELEKRLMQAGERK